MRIGILGGSFNPPHLMHKKAAEELINHKYLDKVVFVPTGDLYQKKELISAYDRYKMLKIMTKSNNKLIVSDYELKSHLTYTYQTLNHFKDIYPNDEIFFICGSDNLKELETWKNYIDILKNYKIIVYRRDHDDMKNILSKYLGYQDHIIPTNIILDDLSSTMIRNIIKSDNGISSLNDMMDKEVIDYIKVKRLYKSK